MGEAIGLGSFKRFPRGEMETTPGRGGVERVWRSVFGMAQPEDSPFPHGLEASTFHTSFPSAIAPQPRKKMKVTQRTQRTTEVSEATKTPRIHTHMKLFFQTI